jgi:hypothetical protein
MGGSWLVVASCRSAAPIPEVAVGAAWSVASAVVEVASSRANATPSSFKAFIVSLSFQRSKLLAFKGISALCGEGLGCSFTVSPMIARGQMGGHLSKPSLCATTTHHNDVAWV